MMENSIKFRNHISVIFENIIRTIGIVFFIMIGNLISDGDEGIDMLEGLLIAGVFSVIILVVVVVWQLIIWAKTYIIIQENTLIVERNTLNKKKNTIGLKNISNVNLEQNLLEMVLGTCKVKLDTNTLTTADVTDVTIVLKKADAERFRQLILRKSEEETISGEISQEAAPESKKIVAGMDDILVHGLFSINFFSVLMLAGVLLGAAAVISEMSIADVKEDFISLLFTILVIIWVLAGAIWSIVKGFITYIDFKIERKQDKILLNYGLLKKIAYSIPVDKINAVRLSQTTLARLGKRYTVEIINVGLDNEEGEEKSFFLPYAKQAKIIEQMQMLLPEFVDGIQIPEEKQDKHVWLVKIPGMILYLAVIAVVFLGAMEFLPDMRDPVIRYAALGGVGIFSVALLVSQVAAFFTVGSGMGDEFLKIVDGSFARRTLLVKYEKIQYITAKQNVIAKHYHLQKAEIHLLASIQNQIQDVPYFQEEKLEKLKGKLI